MKKCIQDIINGVAKNGDGSVKGLLGTNHNCISDGGHAYDWFFDNAVSWYSVNGIGRLSFLVILKTEKTELMD